MRLAPHAGKRGNHTVAGAAEDSAAMLRHQRVGDQVVCAEGSQPAFLVRAHEIREFDDVGDSDCSEATLQ